MLAAQMLLGEPLESPLGRLTLSAIVRGGTGMPPRSRRIFGSYAICYVIGDGGGTYDDANGVSRDLTAGDLVVVFPELSHRYGPGPGQRWDEFYLVFDGPVFDLWRQTGLLDPARPVHHLEPVEYWLERFCGILEPRGDGTQSIARLQQALADAMARQVPAVGEADRAWLTRAQRMLEQGDAQAPPLEEIAAALDLSYVGFRKKFTRLAGVSPAKHRMRRLIGRACDLIYEQRLTNRQIADTLGFCDEFHFSKRFKQIRGISPADFRARLPR